MAEDEEVKKKFLAKTKEIEGILLQIGKVEESIAKLNAKIKEAEEAAAAPEPKGDSQGSVGSPPPLNNQAEVIVVLEKALKKQQGKLVKLNTRLNKHAGRRRTRRGGAPPPPPRPTREKLDELNRNLMANPNDAGNVLDYLVAVLSHHRDIFDAVETRRLTSAVKSRNRGEPFAPRVMEIVRSLRLAFGPPPLPILARLRSPADIGGRHRTSRRTRKSRKTRRS
jgi:hypothetical protein